MIGVVGIAKVLLNKEDNIVNEINRDTLMIQHLRKIDDGTCDIKFFIIIKDLPECKNLNDYISLVRPKLEPNINGLLTLIEIKEIKDMGSPQIKHISEL